MVFMEALLQSEAAQTSMLTWNIPEAAQTSMLTWNYSESSSLLRKEVLLYGFVCCLFCCRHGYSVGMDIVQAWI